MTGFGRGASSAHGIETVVEIQSVNNRFLDITVRGGRDVSLVEANTRKLVRKHLERGKVTVAVTWRGESEGEPLADLEKARAYRDALEAVRDELGLPGEIDLAMMAEFRDVIGSTVTEFEDELVWEVTEPALQEAVEALVGMREREGEALAIDLEERFGNLLGALEEIGKLAPGRAAAYGERLKARVEETFDGIALDSDRLHQEIALFADRIDISEEETRLRSHLDQARTLMSGGTAAGRQLNFLLQEIHREVNTLGSKANDQEISHLVVGMKEELEKIREQVQNIE
jgi:uncharacterized protein (TIGR00255 family)